VALRVQLIGGVALLQMNTGGIKMDAVDHKNGGIYKDYEDWYDNGPGSEAFKRSLLSPRTEGPHVPPMDRVLKEETYRSIGRGVNMTDDMMRITVNISINQWRAFRHKFLRLLHKVRLGGM
jgi:hypothetical protein